MSFQAFDLQDRLNLTQNHIFRGNEKMDAFKLQMNWNQVRCAYVCVYVCMCMVYVCTFLHLQMNFNQVMSPSDMALYIL